MDQWNYDMAKCPRSGVNVFGCDMSGPFVMHWRNGSFVIPAGANHYAAVSPMGWLEIPPINLADRYTPECAPLPSSARSLR